MLKDFSMNILHYVTFKNVLIYIALPLLVIAGGIFYRRFLWIPQDNPVEEVIENVIKDYTGKDIDLSPDSPENRI